MPLYCPTCNQSPPENDAALCTTCKAPRPELGFPEDDRLGKVVAGGQFRVARRIGEGGFGVVYEVETIVGGLKRALKVLERKWAEDPDIQSRFINEALVLEQVNHPNVARCFAAGQLDDGELYLLFEFIDGQQLSRLIETDDDGTPVPLGALRAVRIAKQIASGLKAAHEAEILHRDLKPDNILVLNAGAPDEQAKVVDFGIAKLTENGSTFTQSIIGTPEYMPPEQFLPGTPLDARVDIWQLGATLFAMLTGRAPYAKAGGVAGIIAYQQQRATAGPRPSEQVPEMREHPELDAFVGKLLASEPNHRPSSALEVCEELARIEHGLLGTTQTSGGEALVACLCAKPTTSNWRALVEQLSSAEGGDALAARASSALAYWPDTLRRAPNSCWQSARQGNPGPVWPLARSLDLSTRGLGDADIAELAANPALAEITELDLSENGFGDEGLSALAQSPHLSRLTHLHLRRNQIGPRGLAALATATFRHCLRTLSASDNHITGGAARAVASMPALTELDLSGNNLGADGARGLLQGSVFSNLRSLRLANANIGADGVRAVAAADVLGRLEQLDLTHSGADATSVETIARSQILAGLRSLNLAQNNLGRDGILALMRGEALRRLRELDVSGNQLGASGAMALAAASFLRRLSRLHVNDNELGDAGAAAIFGSPYLSGVAALSLARNSISAIGVSLAAHGPPQLTSLDLTHNPLGEGGAAALRTALTGLRIEQLCVGGCELGGTDAARLARSEELRDLDLSRNPLGADGLSAVAAQCSPTVSSLRLSHCNLDASAIAALRAHAFAGLELLDLSSNELGRKGVEALVANAEPLAKLRQLILDDCQIEPAAAERLASSPLAARLETLALAHNALGDLGAETLSRGRQWHLLRHLDVRHNGLSMGGAAAITTSPQLARLERIGLSNNPLSAVVDVYSLTDPDITLMESTFSRLRELGTDFTAAFYDELFARYPGVQPLFAHTDMRKQRQHLMATLVLVIDNLRNPDALEKSVTALGTRHASYGVAPSHYFAVTSTLLDVMADSFGADWTDDLRNAWSDALEAISNAMMSAPHEAPRAGAG